MKRTRAELVIIQALCPGPDVPTEGVVRSLGMFPFLSLSGTVGSPLVRYASSPATRCSNVGGGGETAGEAAAIGDGDGVVFWAIRDWVVNTTEQRMEARAPDLIILLLTNIGRGFLGRLGFTTV